MESLMILLCEGHLCPRFPRNAPPFRRPWLKLRNTCRRNLTQRWVSWSSPVPPEVLVETQTSVTKSEKMGLAETI